MTAQELRWDRSGRAVLVDALTRLGPSHCVVEIHPTELLLTEPPIVRRRDRTGGSRLLECGAALSTAWTVLRMLGQEPTVTFAHDPDRPDVVAVVRTNGVRASTSGEWARYAALRKLADPPSNLLLAPVSFAVLRTRLGLFLAGCGSPASPAGLDPHPQATGRRLDRSVIPADHDLRRHPSSPRPGGRRPAQHPARGRDPWLCHRSRRNAHAGDG